MEISILFCILCVSVILMCIVAKEHFNHEYLRYSSKCFSCESDIIRRYGTADAAWMANPSKTFSTEWDGVAQKNGDISGGFIGKSLKYYF